MTAQELINQLQNIIDRNGGQDVKVELLLELGFVETLMGKYIGDDVAADAINNYYYEKTEEERTPELLDVNIIAPGENEDGEEVASVYLSYYR